VELATAAEATIIAENTVDKVLSSILFLPPSRYYASVNSSSSLSSRLARGRGGLPPCAEIPGIGQIVHRGFRFHTGSRAAHHAAARIIDG
jgi:hypothetical protein